MKKLILIFLFILIYNLTFKIDNCFSQWVWQNSGITTPLRDIKFINRTAGWACGDGVIMKTTNAGTNWIIQNQPATDKSLYSINPVNNNVIFCVGLFETILKSTNGGNNWIVIRNGPLGYGDSYQSSYFVNETTGWIAGGGRKY